MVVGSRRSLYHDPVAPGSQNVRRDFVAMPRTEQDGLAWIIKVQPAVFPGWTCRSLKMGGYEEACTQLAMAALLTNRTL